MLLQNSEICHKMSDLKLSKLQNSATQHRQRRRSIASALEKRLYIGNSEKQSQHEWQKAMFLHQTI